MIIDTLDYSACYEDSHPRFAKDVALWKPGPDATPLHLGAGFFAILFPLDAHAPGVEREKPEQLFKVVVKVAVE